MPDAKPNRRKLAKQLQKCLEGLQKYVSIPYTGDSSLDQWPSSSEIERFTTIVEKLARAMGGKKVNIGSKLMRRIDRYYKKLGSMAFAEALLRKIEALPVGPVTRITRMLETGSRPDREGELKAIRDLVQNNDWQLAVKAGDLRNLGPLLLELSSVVSKAISNARPPEMNNIDFEESKRLFNEAFALAGLMGLQREHFLWMSRWNTPVSPLTTWLYMLRVPSIDRRLRQVQVNPNPTPAVLSSSDRRAQQRMKKRRYRQKQARL